MLLLGGLLVSSAAWLSEMLFGILSEEQLLMGALGVPDKLPLSQNPCDVRFHTYAAGKGCQIK